MPRTATRCNTLQHTATCDSFMCDTAPLRRAQSVVTSAQVRQMSLVTTHCNTLQHTATHCDTLRHTVTHCCTRRHTVTHCNTLRHAATHQYSYLRRSVTCEFKKRKCNKSTQTTHNSVFYTLYLTMYTRTHCNTLQHTTTHFNTQTNQQQHTSRLHSCQTRQEQYLLVFF